MNQSKFSQIEEEIIKTWRKEKTFQKSLDNRNDAKQFMIYDGPPFANGEPHYGHILISMTKDAISRYKTMRGYFVPRPNGWDCHGLPVENYAEKQLGLKNKSDIEKLGIDKFNLACKDSVFLHKDLFEDTFERVGRWAETDKSYATLDTSYIESVWWVVKQLSEKGLFYESFKSMPYCPRCATPLSNFELNLGYQDDISDPSLYVKFKLNDEDAYLLGWTTTPWSLPGNAAVAVSPEEKYVYVEINTDDKKKQTLILAQKKLDVLDSDNYHIIKEVTGQELVGKSYEPLFELSNITEKEGGQNLYKVWSAESVSIEEGTGVLHVAPAFGEEDLLLGEKHNLPVLSTVDDNGHVVTGIGIPQDIEGKFFKQADSTIIEYLTKKRNVFAAETFKHTYPFCWRCDTPLFYNAVNTWFVDVVSLKEKLLNANQKIDWLPKHIKDGRFGKWLDGARDWAVSRNRYWGTPLPVWQTKDKSETIIVGSIDELKKRAINPEKIGDDLHRPYIDDIVLKTDSGKEAYRVTQVLDCWFDSGSMPYAQIHYPFENAQKFENQFPADFIMEGMDQTRGWFYTLHVLSTALFNKPAFKNVVVNGLIMAGDGKKMSKRLKNYPDPQQVFNTYGADTLRMYLLSTPVLNGESIRFSEDGLKEINRNVLMRLNNIFSFYKMYADIDKWQPKDDSRPISKNLLDKWILARLDETFSINTKYLDRFEFAKAIEPIFVFLDDLSNWYVRRSRRRFWKSDNDEDKECAYQTLWYVLMRTCQILAPWAPFTSDYLWRQLISPKINLDNSVHLSDWPEPEAINDQLLRDMSITRHIITIGLSIRADKGIKVRQPLKKVTVQSQYKNLSADLIEIIKEELNVKKVLIDNKKPDPGKSFSENLTEDNFSQHYKVNLDTNLTDELKVEGVMRDLVRLIQNARKNAGLEVSDRIFLSVNSESVLVNKALNNHRETIMNETLCKELNTKENLDYNEEVKIESELVVISIVKA